MGARDIVNLAETELASISKARLMLPGEFNIAASTLFGGHYQGLHVGKQEWAAADLDFGHSIPHNRSMSDVTADMIFKTVSTYERCSAEERF